MTTYRFEDVCSNCAGHEFSESEYRIPERDLSLPAVTCATCGCVSLNEEEIGAFATVFELPELRSISGAALRSSVRALACGRMSARPGDLTVLEEGSFVARGESVILEGRPGVARTDLAVDLGRAVHDAGGLVCFITAGTLARNLAYPAQRERYLQPELLVITNVDEGAVERELWDVFIDFIVGRSERQSVLVTTSNDALGRLVRRVLRSAHIIDVATARRAPIVAGRRSMPLVPRFVMPSTPPLS